MVENDENILIRNDYEKRMIEAFVNKPEKTQWYLDAFAKYSRHGVDNMAWHWNWWAFFGSIFYLFYRRAYAAGLALFVVFSAVSLIPFAGLVAWVLTGGYSTYFLYKTYKTRKFDIEMRLDNEERRFAEMRRLSGPKNWVIWVGAVAIIAWTAGMVVLSSAILDLILNGFE